MARTRIKASTVIVKKVDWADVMKQFDKEMFDKLRGLPGHREVPEQLKEFRSIISHEFPEAAPETVFQRLIKLLLSSEKVDIYKLRRIYLEPELGRERRVLSRHVVEFEELKQNAESWVKSNLPEDRLHQMWEAHETWLPRRYTVYSKRVSFQKTASDTLARFYLIKKYGYETL